MSVSSGLNQRVPARNLVRDSLRKHAPHVFEEDCRPYPDRHRKQEPAEQRTALSEHARPLHRPTGEEPPAAASEEPTRVVTVPPVPSDRLPARAPQAALRAAIEVPARKQRGGPLGAILRALPRGTR